MQRVTERSPTTGASCHHVRQGSKWLREAGSTYQSPHCCGRDEGRVAPSEALGRCLPAAITVELFRQFARGRGEAPHQRYDRLAPARECGSHGFPIRLIRGEFAAGNDRLVEETGKEWAIARRERHDPAGLNRGRAPIVELSDAECRKIIGTATEMDVPRIAPDSRDGFGCEPGIDGKFRSEECLQPRQRGMYPRIEELCAPTGRSA